MYHRRLLSALLILITVLSIAQRPATALAQGQTVGLFQYDSAAFPGYTILDPMSEGTVYLLDMWGREVHRWESDFQPAASVYLLPDGDLMRTANPENSGANKGGLIERFSWDGTRVWRYDYNDSLVRAHHDIEVMPNGNVLILAWEHKSDSEAIAAGRDPLTIAGNILSPEHVIEVQPVGDSGGVVVWEWHLWDHLIQDFDSTKANYGVVEDHPELMDLNYQRNGSADWIHANALDYDPDLDQIAISASRVNELWVIDHSTSTAESAGHTGGNSGMGGDFLYRWGNPQVYRAGDSTDQKLFGQHNVHWIPPGLPGAGNIMIFNNGGGRPEGNYSTIDEITPPVDGLGNYAPLAPGEAHGPSTLTWSYGTTPPTDWYSRFISGATRQPNGNTLICSGAEGRFFEVTPDSQVVWEYVNPHTSAGPVPQGDSVISVVFRCYRYPLDYAAFDGRDLTPASAVELYPLTIAGTTHSPSAPTRFDSVIVTTTVSTAGPLTAVEVHADTGAGYFTIAMQDDGNHHDGAAGDMVYGAVIPPVYSPITVPYYINAIDDTLHVTPDPANPPATVYWYRVEGVCDCPYQADFDANNAVDAVDLATEIDVVFFGTPDTQDPQCVVTRGDFNADGETDSVDLSELIDFVYFGGTGPVDPCGP